MLELQEIVHQLAVKDEVLIQGEPYKIANAVYITDGEVLKTRLLLKSLNTANQCEIDIGISARIYKR